MAFQNYSECLSTFQKLKGGVMDIQRKAFESSNNVNPDWSFKFDEELQQYIAIDFEMTNQVDEFNEHWDTFRAGWQAAKAQAVPEGFVLVPVKEIKTWYLDDSEGIYREDPEWLCEIPVGEVVEVEHRVSYELDQDPVFAAIQWDEENSDIGYYETFKSKVEAEKVAAHCKAMVETQEPAND